MLGRFLSPDPIGIAGGINLYAYTFDDPMNWVDRLGLTSGSSGGGGGGGDWACMKCSRTGKGWGPKGNSGRGGGRGSGGGGGDDDGLEGDVGATADAVDAYQAVMFGGVFDQGALEDVALMGAFLSAGGGPDLSNAPAAGFVTVAAPGVVPSGSMTVLNLRTISLVALLAGTGARFGAFFAGEAGLEAFAALGAAGAIAPVVVAAAVIVAVAAADSGGGPGLQGAAAPSP